MILIINQAIFHSYWLYYNVHIYVDKMSIRINNTSLFQVEWMKQQSISSTNEVQCEHP